MNTNRILIRKLPYDPDKDIQPVVFSYMSRNILAVTLSLPVASVRDLVAYARTDVARRANVRPE